MYNEEIFGLDTIEDIRAYLFENADESYRDFTSNLIPTIDINNIIGVRVPIIRALAKKLKNTEVSEKFMGSAPHRYLEENHLHGFLIENVKDFEEALALTNAFLPYIDNWATCDCLRPKVFKKDLPALYDKIIQWVKSDHVYTVRYAIGLLNSFYLDDAFENEHLSLVSGIKRDEYYINMMIAWYFATALSKQYDVVVKIFEEKVLQKFTHNKAIQKACESFRVDKNTKEYLRTLKIK